MADVIDPMMQDLTPDFCKENSDLLIQLEAILEETEDTPENTSKELANFGQIIDRIMGATKTMGLKTMSAFCELGKVIAYKSSQTHDEKIQEIVVAVLFDSVDLLKKMNTQLLATGTTDLKKINTSAFTSRLQWLSNKFKDIDRASCAIETDKPEKNNMAQTSIDDLLADLGL